MKSKLLNPKVYEVRVGRTRYTAQYQSEPNPHEYIQFARHNSDGETVLFFPASLIWKIAMDKLRVRVHSLVESLVLKDLEGSGE